MFQLTVSPLNQHSGGFFFWIPRALPVFLLSYTNRTDKLEIPLCCLKAAHVFLLVFCHNWSQDIRRYAPFEQLDLECHLVVRRLSGVSSGILHRSFFEGLSTT